VVQFSSCLKNESERQLEAPGVEGRGVPAKRGRRHVIVNRVEAGCVEDVEAFTANLG
jgi:hypothetical protein